MAERPYYANAPIVEAVIDFHVVLPDDLTYDNLASFHKLVKADYPQSQTLFEHKVELTVNDILKPKSIAETKCIGYRLDHKDKRYVIQPRLTGFSVSILPPYDTWEPFRDEAKRLWDMYCTVAQPKAVTRAAVRYINQIDIPIPPDPEKLQQEKFFRVYPEVPRDYPCADMADLLMRIAIPQTDIEAMLILTQARVAPKSEQPAVSIVLDIDLFGARQEKPWMPDEDDLWEYLEALHDRKNQIFELSITDATKELIK